MTKLDFLQNSTWIFLQKACENCVLFVVLNFCNKFLRLLHNFFVMFALNFGSRGACGLQLSPLPSRVCGGGICQRCFVCGNNRVVFQRASLVFAKGSLTLICSNSLTWRLWLGVASIAWRKLSSHNSPLASLFCQEHNQCGVCF